MLSVSEKDDEPRTPGVLANALREDAGFTLLEFMLALFITGVLAVLVLQTYPFVMRYMVSWEDRVTLENDAHLTLQRMALDVAQADQISETSPSAWIFYSEGRPAITYEWVGDSLMRNDVRMHKPDIRVLDATYRFSSLHTAYVPLAHQVTEGTSEWAPLQATVSLTLSSPRNTIVLETAILSQRQRSWQPLLP